MFAEKNILESSSQDDWKPITNYACSSYWLVFTLQYHLWATYWQKNVWFSTILQCIVPVHTSAGSVLAYELYFIVSFLWLRNSVRFEHLWHLMFRVPQVSVHCKVSKRHLHVAQRQLNATTFFRPCVKLINSIQTVWRCYVRYPMANMWELVHWRLQGNLIRPYE